jgi:hypothetical protein
MMFIQGFSILLWYICGENITTADWKNHGKDIIEASDKYGLTSLMIEAE